MIDEYFGKRQPRHILDLNIVPILDMLTTIIFFLLLSTSFMEYTKITIPPAKVSTSSDPVAAPPLAPKIMLVPTAGGKDKLILSWRGATPGELIRDIQAADVTLRRAEILQKSEEITREFSRKYEDKEKSIQLGLGAKVPYQDLISLMDGVREVLPDLVLISYREAEFRGDAVNSALKGVEK